MNGSQPPEAQKPSPASPVGANGHSNNSSSSLAAKKRKKDGLKPIITMEGSSPQTPGISDHPVAERAIRGMWQGHEHGPRAWAWAGERLVGIDIGNEIGRGFVLLPTALPTATGISLDQGTQRQAPELRPKAEPKRATAQHRIAQGMGCWASRHRASE
ncbi:hypothetical protein G7Z17_g12389 [Cylindrodendrum hubeiense]|uniref:Uncharacterized protein n=1 Tax=Cylindrodendrum hubeiense TaxID=595255 RepID=A0A9P5H359_9HYPO|nr:hypothetical protein G7Z17_g12389 [Cylindrodendrum hubeiense]